MHGEHTTTRETETALYVSTIGNDEWSGDLPAPNEDRTDGPFATLEAARDAIRVMKEEDALPQGGVTVWVRGGTYLRQHTFELTEEDSGTPHSPIIYRACHGEEVRLLGGQLLTEWKPVQDAGVRERLSREAREQVCQADLRAHGIQDYGRLRHRGFGRETLPAHAELFCEREPMTLARWPNEGFVEISDVPEDGSETDAHGGVRATAEAGFYYEGDRPQRWQDLENLWLHGYWCWDWADSHERLDSYDPETGRIRVHPPGHQYGYRRGQRFYFQNVLEELDSPGEYFVDTDGGMVYFWPTEPLDRAECLISILETPLVSTQDTCHVTLRGIALEAGRAAGMEINGGHGMHVQACPFRNLGTDAVVIAGGAEHSVSGCEFSGLGEAGVRVSGGNRETLEACGHAVRNNRFERFGRWCRTYTPAVRLHGVGIQVAHNLICHAPHSGILFQGNENLMEFNEIHHVTLETGDCGAIYTGRDYTARGNVIRHNYIHDTGGVGMGSMGVYLDDNASGQVVMGNLFVRVERAVFIGGGRDNEVLNNVFVDCEPAIHVDGRGLDDAPVWHNQVYETMRERLEAMNYHQPPYSERYPELQDLDKYFEVGAGVPPEHNHIARNIFEGGTWLDVTWHAEEDYLDLEENLIGEDPRFVDPENDDYRLQEGSPARDIEFSPIPIEQIGPMLPEES